MYAVLPGATNVTVANGDGREQQRPRHHHAPATSAAAAKTDDAPSRFVGRRRKRNRQTHYDGPQFSSFLNFLVAFPAYWIQPSSSSSSSSDLENQNQYQQTPQSKSLVASNSEEGVHSYAQHASCETEISAFMTSTASTIGNIDKSNIEDCVRESTVFFHRLQTAILVLGLELGILVQGSTVGVQYLATTYFARHRTGQLLLSLGSSYVLAVVAFWIFFVVQNVVRLFLRELALLYKEWEATNHCEQQQQQQQTGSGGASYDYESSEEEEYEQGHYSNNDYTATQSSSNYLQQQRHHHAIMEEWVVDFQCKFVQGTVAGIVLAWMGVDVLIHTFGTRVIYGGTVFLLALGLFMIQVWYRHNSHGRGGTGRVATDADTAATTTSGTSVASMSNRSGKYRSNGSMIPLETEVAPFVVDSGRVNHRSVVRPESFRRDRQTVD